MDLVQGVDDEPSKAHRQFLDKYVDVPPLDNNTRLEYYYGVARQIVQQARRFDAAADTDRAYIFYKRFLRLAIDRMPDHMAYRDSRYNFDKTWLIQERRHAIDALESVKRALDIECFAARGDVPPSAPQPQPPPSVPDLSTSASVDDLESRLRALRADSLGSVFGSNSGAGPRKADADDDPPLDLSDSGSGGSTFSPARLGGAQGGWGTGGAVCDKDRVDREAAFRLLRMDGEGPDGQQRYYPVLRSTSEPLPTKSQPNVLSQSVDAAALPGKDKIDRTRLRPLYLPRELAPEFLRIAEPNTRKNIETAGILAGKMDEKGLYLTTVVIPKQYGSSDKTEMVNEEEVWEICYRNPNDVLFVLGWIHTHPQHRCFMSSIDVHTHVGYQLMLPEALSIVLAPTDKKVPVGIFRLTEPYGLQLIQKCELRGFHEHPSDLPIYREHEVIHWVDAKFEVIDLRK